MQTVLLRVLGDGLSAKPRAHRALKCGPQRFHTEP
jgi:hypothetical protein